MKRCEFCGGGFGLISHRHFRKRFCRKRCKENYLAARAQKLHFYRRQRFVAVAKSS
jgi:hypothetical protein